VCGLSPSQGTTARGQTSEDELLDQVLKLAALQGWRAFHVRDSRRGILQGLGASGFPDLVLCDGRRVLYRELKAEAGRLSPGQAAWGDELQAAGEDWRIWRPSDWPDIVATLTRET
jgi:hypothetical protein